MRRTITIVAIAGVLLTLTATAALARVGGVSPQPFPPGNPRDQMDPLDYQRTLQNLLDALCRAQPGHASCGFSNRLPGDTAGPDPQDGNTERTLNRIVPHPDGGYCVVGGSTRVTGGGGSDGWVWPPCPPGVGGPPPCVSNWVYSFSEGPAWIRDGGAGEHWWGTREWWVDAARCVSGGQWRNIRRTCWASNCIAIAEQRAFEQIETQIRGTSPTISTSPDPETLVHIATWFWHDEWSEHVGFGAHGIAPTTVTQTAEPVETWWNYGEGDMYCDGEPQPFDFSLLEHDDDPDADCNSWRFTYPSLGTGPGGSNVYVLEAQAIYELTCEVGHTPRPYTLPPRCRNYLYEGAPIAEHEIPVYELQTVFR